MATSIHNQTGADAARGSNGNTGTALAREARPNPSSATPYQRLADEDRGTGGESLANFLGLFSIGLGMAEALIPGAMTKLIGVRDDDRNRNLMRTMGMREIG